MQFQRRSNAGSLSVIGKLLIKILLVILVLFIGIILIDRIEFPSPNKNIEKVLPNENFKIIK
tara:strand:- start:247 stop:432 length:186 start_codon:yes stop_codon:yes gene_type:complete